MSAQQPESLPPTEYDREVDRAAREILKVRRTAQKKTYWAKSSTPKDAYREKERSPLYRGK